MQRVKRIKGKQKTRKKIVLIVLCRVVNVFLLNQIVRGGGGKGVVGVGGGCRDFYI